ncbi:hypothetical protein [Georgenia sp. SUBG003]|uniref:hypothetical protein n=1 Tax=Georgenia sp. SUBG003 TaxID=1497974 RepID=UPI003AB22D7F
MDLHAKGTALHPAAPAVTYRCRDVPGCRELARRKDTMELMQAVEEFVLGLAGSPWILLAVTVLATIDGFFPPVPSESIVIAVAALSVSGDAPEPVVPRPGRCSGGLRYGQDPAARAASTSPSVRARCRTTSTPTRPSPPS